MKRRRIALLTHFYPPEPCAAANRIASLAAALAKSGDDVTVVTNFPSFPSGKLLPSDRRRWIDVETCDGIRVVRLATRTFRGWPASRLLQWAWSACSGSCYLLSGSRRFDDIVVTIPPITLALPAMLARWRHRAKLVVDVRDVFPDIAVAMGEWKAGGVLARATAFVARALYRRADLVAAVTPTALRQIAARGVPESRLLLAPNGFELHGTVDISRRADTAPLVAIYAGNLGLATGISTVLDAAALLRDDARVAIHIVGGGVEAERVRRRVAQEALANVTLAEPVSREIAMHMIAAAGVAIVPLRKGIYESVPTKIFDAFAVGCPVLVSADGEARAAVVSCGGGIAVEPDDPVALAEALVRVATMPARERSQMGERGREHVQKHHRRERIMREYSQRIAALGVTS